MIFYAGLTLVVSNMFYQEYWGLNALIIATIYIMVSVFTSTTAESPLKKIKWYFAALLFIANGFALFYIHGILSHFLYFFSFLYFVAVQNELQFSFPLGLIQSMQSFFSGFYLFIESFANRFEKKEKKEGSKPFVKVLLFTIPIVIAIVFLKLYQNADATFYELTKFINLDWISWGFIGFYFFIFLFFYGFNFYNKNKGISALESTLKNSIESDYTDGIENYMGVENEKKIAISLLLTLNLMLLLYNLIDLKFIFIDLPNPSPTMRYSDLLHGGVNSLITSIILVIFIITFIYRGQLNFQGSKFTRVLALIWLLLNIVMVSTTVVKNYAYIAHWGLTYKRIGVYIYLILAAAGLLFTIVKIIRIKSIWFLIRNTSLAFFTCFTLIGFFNWDKIIVQFNLTQINTNNTDFDYLLSLGADGYPDLMDYYLLHYNDSEIRENQDAWHQLFESFDTKRERLIIKSENTTWRSLNIRDKELLERMNKYNLVYVSNLNWR